jgi:TetR/AcrR family transcriptional regulator
MLDKIQRVRDPEAARSNIIDAAERLFAENGFAATSLRDISTASGVSHPLILHHFGSKEDLYLAVKRRAVERYAARFPRAARAVNRPLSVSAEMRRLMAFIGENPQLLRLCLRTRLEGDTQVWPGEPDQLDTMRKRLEVSQKRGLIRDDLDPRYLSIMISGLVFFCLENEAHFRQRFGESFDMKEYLRQAIAFAESGLALASESAGVQVQSGELENAPDHD